MEDIYSYQLVFLLISYTLSTINCLIINTLSFVFSGNKRLQEMMGIMAGERGATLYATDER